jgi:hypothetical protein
MSIYTKTIEFDRETRDFACYLNDELIGFGRTPAEAEALLDRLVYELLMNAPVEPVTPELVPDPETWVAVSAEYTGNSTAGLDGGADIDPDAVYCEVCGCGVTAEDAVLDGEQMVCCDCATPAPVPAERADWTQALVLSGPLFEALCDAADAARAYWAHVPARLKVINDGWAWLLERNVIHCNAAGDLLYPSESTAGLVHVVGVSCSCTAGRWGQHCKHAAAADILGRARRLMSAQKAA